MIAHAYACVVYTICTYIIIFILIAHHVLCTQSFSTCNNSITAIIKSRLHNLSTLLPSTQKSSLHCI